MLERRELEERIAEIKGKRNQTENDIVRMAAFIIARDDLDKDKAVGSYGDAAPAPVKPTAEAVIGDYGDTEFLHIIAGRNPDDVWPIIAEAMESLKLMEPRFYAGILRKINK